MLSMRRSKAMFLSRSEGFRGLFQARFLGHRPGEHEDLPPGLNAGRVGSKKIFDYLFLRDACSCPKCVDTSTRQKKFAFEDIPRNITPKSEHRLPDGGIEMTWQDDITGYEKHSSVYSQKFLHEKENFSRRVEANHNTWKVVPWTRQVLHEKIDGLSFNYSDYQGSKKALRGVLRQLLRYGIVFIHNVPIQASSVKAVAERIGPLRQTFYGETWDVRSEASAKNVAYTSGDLGFHQDLLYMANPPGLQFLHVMKASTEGGESLFSDALTAFYKLQDTSPDLVQSLTDFPVTYHYRNNGQWYQYSRPTLEGGTRLPAAVSAPDKNQALVYPQDFEAINWSPPFQGPFEQDSGLYSESSEWPSPLRKFQTAASQLKQWMESEANVYETLIKEGTCVIFNNRRLLHARRSFRRNEGERLLRGAYVDTDCLMSRWRVLSEDNE